MIENWNRLIPKYTQNKSTIVWINLVENCASDFNYRKFYLINFWISYRNVTIFIWFYVCLMKLCRENESNSVNIIKKEHSTEVVTLSHEGIVFRSFVPFSLSDCMRISLFLIFVFAIILNIQFNSTIFCTYTQQSYRIAYCIQDFNLLIKVNLIITIWNNALCDSYRYA